MKTFQNKNMTFTYRTTLNLPASMLTRKPGRTEMLTYTATDMDLVRHATATTCREHSELCNSSNTFVTKAPLRIHVFSLNEDTTWAFLLCSLGVADKKRQKKTTATHSPSQQTDTRKDCPTPRPQDPRRPSHHPPKGPKKPTAEKPTSTPLHAPSSIPSHADACRSL